MYEKFGEFNSADELNEAASGLLDEGDTKNIYILAKENGIDEEVARCYIDKLIPYLCDEESAAIGKLTVEAEQLKVKEIVADWVEYIKACVIKDSSMAKAVRRKDKNLKGCIAKLLSWSFKNCYLVDKDITKEAGITQTVKMGIPGMGTAKNMIRDYYMGK